MVMLTLTRANTGQVLSLARELQDRADLFTFDRLSMVVDGVHLTPAKKDEFKELLASYQKQARTKSVRDLRTTCLIFSGMSMDSNFLADVQVTGAEQPLILSLYSATGKFMPAANFPPGWVILMRTPLKRFMTDSYQVQKRPEACIGCVIRHIFGLANYQNPK